MTEQEKPPIIIEYFNYGMSKHAKLVVPPGKLCILKGENNNGKSCLFYGLEWLLFNDPLAKTLINNKSLEENSKAELKVRITQGDYFIELKRSMNAISYNINGEIHDKKLNKQSIFDIKEGVHVPGITYVPNCVYPLFNVHDEDRGLFPISENNDQNIYVLFEKLLGLINSKKVITAAQAEQSETTSQCEMLETECLKNTQKLEKLTQILEETNIEGIKTLISNTELTEQQLTHLNRSKETVSKFATALQASIPDTINISQLSQLATAIKAYTYAQQQVIANSASIQLPNCIQTKELELCQKAMTILQKAKSEYYKHSSEIDKLTQELLANETELKSLQAKWDSIEVCPMCGQPKHVGELTCLQR